jgi:outer membrane lipoprotein-sorting protein
MKRTGLIVSILAGVVLVILILASGCGASQTSSDAALSTMLTGYTKWQTLQGEAEFIWYGNNGETQSQTNKFALVLPDKAYVDVTGDIGPNVPGMWISDGQTIYMVDKKAKTYTQRDFPKDQADTSRLPTSLSQLKHAGGVITHPMAILIVAPIGRYLFPIWFPQGYIGDKYSIQREDNFLGRKVWVIECDTIHNDNLTAWVDQETGIILKYNQITQGKKYLEMTFMAFQVNGQISPDVFSLPPGYSQASP